SRERAAPLPATRDPRHGRAGRAPGRERSVSAGAPPGLWSERAVASERFAIAGVRPRFAARPSDREELCELVRAAARDGLAIVPWGGGIALPAELALERYDAAIDLGALQRVIEYE